MPKTMPSRSSANLREHMKSYLDTGVAIERSLVSPYQSGSETGAAWGRIIDDVLIEWGREPSPLHDDDFEPPAKAALRTAIRLAESCRAERWAPPNRVVPDGEGGIVFERWAGESFEQMNIDPTGRNLEILAFRGSKLVSRAQQALYID